MAVLLSFSDLEEVDIKTIQMPICLIKDSQNPDQIVKEMTEHVLGINLIFQQGFKDPII